jgi:hypothetical protein
MTDPQATDDVSEDTLRAWMKGASENIESGVATDLIAVCPVALRRACRKLLEYRGDWLAEEAEVTRRGIRIEQLEAEVYRLRGIVTRQRRELHRLNKTLRSIWEGVRFSINTRYAQHERAKHPDVGTAQEAARNEPTR